MTAKIKKLKAFDPAEYLDDPKAIAAYLEEAFDTGDAKFIADAMGVVARASGMSEIARATGLSRESLYKALSTDGNPEFGTVLRVINALGLKLAIEPQTST
jgi:probable addiction module antidote protein